MVTECVLLLTMWTGRPSSASWTSSPHAAPSKDSTRRRMACDQSSTGSVLKTRQRPLGVRWGGAGRGSGVGGLWLVSEQQRASGWNAAVRKRGAAPLPTAFAHPPVQGHVIVLVVQHNVAHVSKGVGGPRLEDALALRGRERQGREDTGGDSRRLLLARRLLYRGHAALKGVKV